MRIICRVLKFSRAGYYRYKKNGSLENKKDNLTDLVIKVFRDSKGNYGSRRIKAALLNDYGVTTSRRRIRRLMKENFLFSSYQVANFKVHHKSSNVNEDPITNSVDRKFDGRTEKEVLISDLTYVRVASRTAYICFISDLFNREIIGWSVGFFKTPELVLEAFYSIPSLKDVKWFHTDRGSEFKNMKIDSLLSEFGIKRSLSHKGTPYDNACAESLYSKAKVEFVRNQVFPSLEKLRTATFEWVYWYNHKRLHSTLGYMSPIAYKETHPAI